MPCSADEIRAIIGSRRNGVSVKRTKIRIPGKLGVAFEAGEVTFREAKLVMSCPVAHERLENRGGSVQRYVNVAKAWHRNVDRTLKGKPRPHYTRYNKDVIAAIEVRIGDSKMILDPMAGTMERLAVLEDPARGWHLVHGVEYEPEWVEGYKHPRLVCGDARSLPFPNEHFDAIIVSPSYGNRDADRTGDWWDNVDRKTYAGALGRNVTAGSLCVPFEDPEYKIGHTLAWCEAVRVLKPYGLFVINLKNHIKQGQIVRVSQWHREVLRDLLRLREIDDTAIPTTGRLSGENYKVRAENAEKIYIYSKPPTSTETAMDLYQTMKEKYTHGR